MKIIDTKILSGDNHPQLKIGDKLYIVDDRKSTFDKIMAVQNDVKVSQEKKELSILEMSLGKKAAKEILAMDLSVKDYTYLTFCIMGAITGEDPDKLRDNARKN